MALSRCERFCMLVFGTTCVVASTPSYLLGQTWDGGGPDNNWTTGLNWTPDGSPANNGTANIIFGGTTRLTPNVNVIQDIRGLTFNGTAGAFTIGGTTLTIRDIGIANNDADTQTINVPIVLTNPSNLSANLGRLVFGGTTMDIGILGVSGSFDISIGNAISGAGGTLFKAGTGVLTLSGANSYAGGTVINQGSLSLSANNALLDTGAVTVNSSGTLVLNGNINDTIGALSGNGSVNLFSAAVLIIGGGDATSTFSGVISGNGTVGKTGTGTLMLSGANTYDGNTAIFDGELRLGNNQVIANASTVVANSGGTFNLAGFSETIRDLGGQGAVLLGSGTLTVAPLAGSFYSGIMSGTGNLTVNGANSMTLLGANTYTGTTTVTSNMLRIGASERLADASDLTVNGGIFDLQSFNETVDVITLTNGSIIGSGTLIANAYDVENGTINVHLGGSAGLNKTTAGTVTLANTNTYTGATDVADGTLVIAANDVLPDVPIVVVGAAGRLRLDAGVTDTIGGLYGEGNVELADTATLFLDVAAQPSDMFFGVISGTGDLSKTGPGMLQLFGANTYTGRTVVVEGILDLGADERLSDESGLFVEGGTFDLHAFDETVGGVVLKDGSILGTGTLTATLFSVLNGQIAANLAGPAALVMQGFGGTVTLAGTNSYTGVTILEFGTLEVYRSENLGPGEIRFNGGVLRTVGSVRLVQPIALNIPGAIETVGTTTLAGPFSGPGELLKNGLGTLVIEESPQLSGLTVAAGKLELPIGGTLIVTGDMTVGSDGLLSLDGGLVSANSFANGGEIELLAGARLNGLITNSGVIAGDGRISGALTNNPTGEILVTNGESLQFTSTGSSSNTGVLDVLDAELVFDGELTNLASTGLIFARDALLRFNGGLINAGSVALSFGITDIFGDIENQNGASIVISGRSDATMVGDVVNDGMIRVSQGSAAVFFGAVSGGGSFPGTGTVFLEGDLRPGASPAQINFGGDLVLGTFSTLEIEIGGTQPGTEHDQLVVAGDASLGGTLVVKLIDGFVPSSGQSFSVIRYASHNGWFRAIDVPAVSGLCIRVVEGSTDVMVTANTSAGDANGDCNVGLSDFLSLSECLNGPDGGPNAPVCGIFDFGADDDVDLRDVASFQTAFTGR